MVKYLLQVKNQEMEKNIFFKCTVKQMALKNVTGKSSEKALLIH